MTATDCDPTQCGAIHYAEHDKLSRCVKGHQFKVWDENARSGGAWADSTDPQYLAQDFVPIRKSLTMLLSMKTLYEIQIKLVFYLYLVHVIWSVRSDGW